MYEIIPESIGLKYYSTETRSRNIRVDGHIKLVEIDLKKLTAKGYAKIRRNLAKYMITVYYQGVYDEGTCRQTTKDLSELFGHTYRDPYKKEGSCHHGSSYRKYSFHTAIMDALHSFWF